MALEADEAGIDVSFLELVNYAGNTEESAVHLLENAKDSSFKMDEKQSRRIRCFAEMMAHRALIWERVSLQLRERSEETMQKAKEMQKVADDLASLAARFSNPE